MLVKLVFVWCWETTEPTGLTIHFCLEPLSSQALRSSLMSRGKMKVWGIKLNSCLPNWSCILDRFLHRRSFLPIWNVPGKWFNYNIKKATLMVDFVGVLTGISSRFSPSGAFRALWTQGTSCGVPSSPTSRGFLHEAGTGISQWVKNETLQLQSLNYRASDKEGAELQTWDRCVCSLSMC